MRASSLAKVCKSLFALAAIAFVLNILPTDANPRQPAQKRLVEPTKIVDLTQVLAPGMPDFHGDRDAFKYTRTFTIEENGYANGSFMMPEHLGTHIDAPSHFDKDGKSIDNSPPESLILPCVVIDVRDEVKRNSDYCLTLEKIKAFEKNGGIPQGSAVLLLTGWSTRWNEPETYRNLDKNGIMHFPGFSSEAADYLASTKHVSCLGIDTLSIDAGDSSTFTVHNHELAKGLIFIENLTNLDTLPARGATLFCGPLRIKDGTGSPARILAVVPKFGESR
jgi:kynurenine formamidase